MKIETVRRLLILTLVAGLAPCVAACGISVNKDDDGRNKNVDIHTPLGNLSVKANSDTMPDTGLPVRAGARPLREKDHDNADVNIEGGFFGVKVAVARFEDDGAPREVLDYYKKELSKYGAVVECHGNLDFKHGSASAARCKERARDETQLGVGSEEDNRVVSVKPRGTGSEFTLVHVRTRD
jgi:hypothetical protein